MKRILMLATVVLLLALGAGTALAQSGYDLFQKALVKERAVGDVEEALRLYQRIVKEFGGNHALAAKAQLRMGLLYDRLGREAEAQRAFQVIVNQYADQTNEAQQARAKIATAAASPRNINASAKTTTELTVRQVWGDAAAGLAAISPDGHHLVYKSTEMGLYVRDLLAGKNRPLTMAGSAGDKERIVAGPVFSPDGKLIAYGWYDSVRTDLRLIALDGSAPRVLNRSAEWPHLVPLDWSSDGKQILALAHGQSGTRHIVLVSVADGSIHALKTVASDYFPSRMSLSPDGRYLVFDYPARGDSPERDIFLLGTDGGHEAGLVTQATDDRYPIWTPDGRGVVFLRNRPGNVSAWFLPVVNGAARGAPELLRSDMGENPKSIGFAQNGSFYYTLRSGTPSDLYVATLNPTTGTITGQPATVTQRSVIQSGGWSPNGQYLAFKSLGPSVQGKVGAPIIVIRSVQTGDESELAPALSGFGFGLRGWSPDSRFLLVGAVDNEKRWGIYRVDARTGDVAPLVYYPRGGSFEHPVWSADGKSIVFIRRENNQDSASHRIVSRDLETGLETELYRPPAAFSFGSCLEVSADGQRLAFYLQHRETRAWSVMVMTAAGEQPRQLGPPVKYPERIDDILALTPDGRHVLFTTYDTEQMELGHKVWRIAVDGGDPREIQIPKDLGYFGVAKFHSDGQRITFAASNRKSTVWVMENFLPAVPTKKTTASRR